MLLHLLWSRVTVWSCEYSKVIYKTAHIAVICVMGCDIKLGHRLGMYDSCYTHVTHVRRIYPQHVLGIVDK